MILTTTHSVDGRRIKEYLGLVTGEAVLGTNIFRDFFAGIRDIVGGRSGSYEKELRTAKETAIGEMVDEAENKGADAILGIDLDFEHIGTGERSMLMVAASGTAVKLG